MDLLVIGGTVFLGRTIVEAALARGHTVTLFNRGQHNPELFPGIEKLHGDRRDSLTLLRDRRWDAVIDPSGYVPRVVRASAELLGGAVEHYTFISSVSVYADEATPNQDESARVATIPDETVETIDERTYGALKALCEQAAERAMPGRVLSVRAGLIVGPHDPTDRFTYWPHRIAQGGEVLVPDGPACRTQFIDVRDLAEWILRMAEARRAGVYNVTGPAEPVTLGELFSTCKAESGSDATFTWASEDFLLAQGVQPWVELPVWVPEKEAGVMRVSIARALAAGLTFRPLAETVRATLDWDAARPPHDWRAGIKPEREREVLQALHQR